MWGKNFDPIVTETWKRLYTFGYGTEQCQVIPSWKGKEVPADCDQADVRISAYVRKDRQEAILALCDLGNADKEFTVDFSRLGFRNCQVTELESNQAVVPSAKHSFRFQLPRRDFRLIHIMEK